MGTKRKKRRKRRKKSSSTSIRRKTRYSPFEIFLAVLGAALLVLAAVLILGAIFGA